MWAAMTMLSAIHRSHQSIGTDSCGGFSQGQSIDHHDYCLRLSSQTCHPAAKEIELHVHPRTSVGVALVWDGLMDHRLEKLEAFSWLTAWGLVIDRVAE